MKKAFQMLTDPGFYVWIFCIWPMLLTMPIIWLMGKIILTIADDKYCPSFKETMGWTFRGEFLDK